MVDPAQPTPPLTSEVQLALQHAVVEANAALSQPNEVQSSTKKARKRRREAGGEGGGRDHGDPATKKRKEQAIVVPPVVSSPRKKRKRSKKGKERVHQSPALDLPVESSSVLPQIDPELQSTNPSASSSAFLSAVVAAASATTEPLSNQVIPPYSHYAHDASSQSQHYAPYPPTQYPYNILQVAQSSQHLQFPTGLAPLPHPEMSNEDILRALHDLDMSKIAHVLKTLNEAASAANISLVPQPTFLDPQLQGFSQIPVPSSTLPVQPPGPAKNQRKLDMTLPGPPHINPDHAQWLSTKWLNANKLAELVRTEGIFRA